MTPSAKIKRDIISLYLTDSDGDEDLDVETIWESYDFDDEDQVNSFYSEYYDGLQEYEQDYRHGQVETNIPTESSRHYESKSVATQMDDGSWVGWVYYFGGGKFGEPEAIEWIENAYDLDCVEEEKMVVVRTFTEK